MDKQKILIVDDEEVNRAILEIMFQTEFEVIQASNGEEAIKQIEENPDIVLILLDIVMPVMDGYMQSKELLEVKPVILITGETIRDSEDKAYSYGVADVIHKPFYPDIVERRAKNIIELYTQMGNHEMAALFTDKYQKCEAECVRIFGE